MANFLVTHGPFGVYLMSGPDAVLFSFLGIVVGVILVWLVASWFM